MKFRKLAYAAITFACFSMSPFACAGGSTSDIQAFNSARDSWVTYMSTGQEGETELIWSDALKKLAMSESADADIYLARLALFRLDGAIGSEFGCAASKRGSGLAVQLKEQARRFSSMKFCSRLALENRLQERRLCASRKEYQVLVKGLSELPSPDVEGACSY
jgi:hypothetical protein